MALSSYMVENYRPFAERTTIELRPLTLLFGYNSAGKSALLRALLYWFSENVNQRVGCIRTGSGNERV
jgi:AAA15 family ATPase/GTPase